PSVSFAAAARSALRHDERRPGPRADPPRGRRLSSRDRAYGGHQTTRIDRRQGMNHARNFALAAVLLALTHGACAQYPAKPIRLVVPFPAGESVDATARLVGQSWSAALGQQILVDNRGGAG